MTALLLFGCPIIKRHAIIRKIYADFSFANTEKSFLKILSQRAKHTLWPSIPNPEKSNVMQKMQMSNELVRFYCYPEKWQTEDWGCFCSSQELLQSNSTLRVEEWDTDSLQIVQKEQAITACISAEMPSLLDGPEDEFGDVQETHVNDTPLAGGYSTMETFRQAVLVSTLVSQEREPGVTVLRSQLDYIRQFSADSTWDNQTLAWRTARACLCCWKYYGYLIPYKHAPRNDKTNTRAKSVPGIGIYYFFFLGGGGCQC